jgi:hypothetical protein
MAMRSICGARRSSSIRLTVARRRPVLLQKFVGPNAFRAVSGNVGHVRRMRAQPTRTAEGGRELTEVSE